MENKQGREKQVKPSVLYADKSSTLCIIPVRSKTDIVFNNVANMLSIGELLL